ncbi:MAG TPA: lysophospholipid acyltransferase family protein [Deferrisomatales bacterium]|nr:lysophospholipid acyltransferase family protein [Deferrisomatales bacterium]
MHSALLRWGPPLGAGYLRLVGATTRYQLVGEDARRALGRIEGPLLTACWHNRLLGPVFPYRNQNAGVAISQSDDGELISRVVEAFGFVPIRGSSSRGGSQVLRTMLRHLGQGYDVVFTPDGPRGPRYLVQPGLAHLACRTGRPVLPVGVGMSRKLVFSSWDRFQLPLPFGRIRIQFGEVLRFTRDDSLGDVQQRIGAALIAATEAADRALGVSSP